MTKRTFESGDGLDHPNDGAMVDVEFKGKYSDSKVFDNRSIKFNVGDGLDVVSLWLKINIYAASALHAIFVTTSLRTRTLKYIQVLNLD